MWKISVSACVRYVIMLRETEHVLHTLLLWKEMSAVSDWFLSEGTSINVSAAAASSVVAVPKHTTLDTQTTDESGESYQDRWLICWQTTLSPVSLQHLHVYDMYWQLVTNDCWGSELTSMYYKALSRWSNAFQDSGHYKLCVPACLSVCLSGFETEYLKNGWR